MVVLLASENNLAMNGKTLFTVLGILLVGLLAYVGYTDAVSTKTKKQNLHREVHHLNTTNEKLDEKLEETIEVKEEKEQKAQQLEQENQNLETEKQRLERELQSKIEAKAKLAAASQQVINTATVTASAAPVATETPAPVSGSGFMTNCGDNEYAAYIYGMESGGLVPGHCDTGAVNYLGCTGIGQSCPASKIAHCGVDYACQNAWFSNYAIERYGSWAAAYAYHKANGWW